MFKWLEKFKRTKEFRVVVSEDFAHDMGTALGRLGLTVDQCIYTGNHEFTLTGKWTPDFYGDTRTMEALTCLPIREAIVF